MFENVTFRRGETKQGQPNDLGLLAETLLFYQTTNLLLDTGNLSHLLRTVGPSTVQRLITTDGVNPLLIRDGLGVSTDHGAIPAHDYAQIEFVGSEEKGILRSKRDRVKHLFERSLGRSAASNKAAIQFAKIVPEHKISFSIEEAKGLPELARADLEDIDFVKRAFQIAVETRIPSIKLGRNWRLVPHRIKNGFVIDTDLDFEMLTNEFRRAEGIDDAKITPQSLLTDLLEARAGLHLSAHFQSDLITTLAPSRIMELRLNDLVQRQIKASDELQLFQRATLGNATSIREAINSGERSFDEFLDLLEHAAQFKEWISGQEPEQSLIKDYYSEVTAGTWAERLPGKTLRWSFFTGAGLLVDLLVPTGLGTATGVAIGAGDAFLLDKVIKGWKPNQFIEGPLQEFVNGKSKTTHGTVAS